MEKLAITPDENGYSVSEASGAILYADLDGGPGRSRLDEISGTRLVNVTWSGSKTRYLNVRTFLNNNVALNCPQFLMNLIIDDYNYKEYTCNIIQDSINTLTPSDQIWSISVQLEVIPRSDETVDWPDPISDGNDEAPYITVNPGQGAPNVDGYFVITVDEEATVTMECHAIGSAPITYNWYKVLHSNPPLLVQSSTSRTYTTPSLQVSDSGSIWYCVASNQYGDTTSYLAMIVVHRLYVNPRYIRVTALSSRTTSDTTDVILQRINSGSYFIGFYKKGVLKRQDASPVSIISNGFNVNNTSFGTGEFAIFASGNITSGSGRLLDTPFSAGVNDKIDEIRFGYQSSGRSYKLEIIDNDLTVLATIVTPIGTGSGTISTLHFSFP